MASTKYPAVRTKVNRLVWGGDMKQEFVTLFYPKEAVKIDSWFSPRVGELCYVGDSIDIVKSIKWSPGSGIFKGCYMYSFENTKKKYAQNLVYRVEVKRGKTFILNGKIFTHHEPLSGHYIEKMADGEKITEYEHNTYE